MLFKIKPIFVEKPWGKNYAIGNKKYQNIGEIYLLSNLDKHHSFIQSENDYYNGKTINELFTTEPKLFIQSGKHYQEFPILLKILIANEATSIQVHPDDAYAKKYENELGKNESWYILDLFDNNHKIGYGHYARDYLQATELITNKKWNDFIRKINVKVGDIIDTPPGTIHSILGGTTIYEIQESSPITYRVYDFDRIPQRPLHLKETLDVLYFPQDSIFPIPYQNVINKEIQLVNNKYYSLEKIIIDTKNYHFSTIKYFAVITIINGNIKIDNHNTNLYDTFFITVNSQITVSGRGEILIARPPKIL